MNNSYLFAELNINKKKCIIVFVKVVATLHMTVVCMKMRSCFMVLTKQVKANIASVAYCENKLPSGWSAELILKIRISKLAQAEWS